MEGALHLINADNWFEKNSFKCQSFSNIKKLVELKRKNKNKISVVIPTLNEEATIGSVIGKIKGPLMDKRKLVDEILVVDSGSTDRTKEIAEKAGAKFVYSGKILKPHGEHKGKGENLWKALYVAEGDIIVYIDADIKNIHPRFVYGLVGPLLSNRKLSFTKAFYQRPIKVGKELRPLGGGRVTEILIRPLFNQYFPRLSGFIQPLSGEFAGRRNVFERIPFYTGYGVDSAMLIDIQRKFGLRCMAQVDLIRRIHRNQTLEALSKMAFGILGVFSRRANSMGKLILMGKTKKTYRTITSSKEGRRIKYSMKKIQIKDVQRPPMITVREYRKKFKKDPAWVYV